jgi:hypothetical protein
MAHHSDAGASDPLVSLFFFERPEAADFAGGHLLIADQSVGNGLLDTKVFGYFVERKPPVFHDDSTLIISQKESFLVLFGTC